MTPDPDPFWRATIAATLLRQGYWLTRLSLGLVLLTLAGTVLAVVWGGVFLALPGVLSLAAGFATLWFGLRTAFDADLFTALATTGDLPGFDRAMIDLGLMPLERAGRALDARIKGAMWLVKAQALALAIQVAALIAGVVLFARVSLP